MPEPRTFQVTLIPEPDGSVGRIPVPFDPREAFGKARAPVVVTINGYTYRSTVSIMNGETFIPLRRSHFEAAQVEREGTYPVTLTLDTEPRTVDPPPDLAEALDANDLRQAWDKLAFTHQREHVEAIESARKPETRAKRLAATIAKLGPR